MSRKILCCALGIVCLLFVLMIATSQQIGTAVILFETKLKNIYIFFPSFVIIGFYTAIRGLFM